MEEIKSNNLETTKKASNTNYCILFFEILACIFIVFLHIKFPSLFGEIVEMFARFGVPFFFMVSGYFLISSSGIDAKLLRTKIKRKLIHLLIILLFGSILYFILDIYTSRSNLSTYFANLFNVKSLLVLVLFNEPLFGGHLWFILALIYSYLFILIFPNLFIKTKIALYLISSLLFLNIIVNVITYQLEHSIFGIPISHYWFYRNWFAEGLPFVALGVLLKKTASIFENKKTKYIVVALCTSLVLMILEGLFYRKILHAYPIFCIFNVVFCLCIFALSVKKPLLFSNFFLSKVEGNWTTSVYVIHPLFITAISFCFAKLNFTHTASLYIAPIAVAISSVVFSIFLSLIIRKIKKIIKNRELPGGNI